jgi:hypothetical protein
MKKIALMMVLFATVFVFVSATVAQEQNDDAGFGWQNVYKDMLEKGKESIETNTDNTGLAYTPAEATVLEEAVAFALSEEKGDRACECMKIAVELEYNPYLVLKTIYGLGGDLEIDTICNCSTQAGVTKAIIAQAATDAVTPLNEPVYEIDEISRSQCLTGLAYQTNSVDSPPDPPDPPASVATF